MQLLLTSGEELNTEKLDTEELNTEELEPDSNGPLQVPRSCKKDNLIVSPGCGAGWSRPLLGMPLSDANWDVMCAHLSSSALSYESAVYGIVLSLVK